MRSSYSNSSVIIFESIKYTDPDPSNIRFEGLISDVFISYLGGYEDLERNNMRQICDRLQSNEVGKLVDKSLRYLCRTTRLCFEILCLSTDSGFENTDMDDC